MKDLTKVLEISGCNYWKVLVISGTQSLLIIVKMSSENSVNTYYLMLTFSQILTHSSIYLGFPGGPNGKENC